MITIRIMSKKTTLMTDVNTKPALRIPTLEHGNKKDVIPCVSASLREKKRQRDSFSAFSPLEKILSQYQGQECLPARIRLPQYHVAVQGQWPIRETGQ